MNMNKNRTVGSPEEIRGKAKEGVSNATGDARLPADQKTDCAEDKAPSDIARDAVRDALAVSAAAMTLGGIH